MPPPRTCERMWGPHSHHPQRGPVHSSRPVVPPIGVAALGSHDRVGRCLDRSAARQRTSNHKNTGQGPGRSPWTPGFLPLTRPRVRWCAPATCKFQDPGPSAGPECQLCKTCASFRTACSTKTGTSTRRVSTRRSSKRAGSVAVASWRLRRPPNSVLDLEAPSCSRKTPSRLRRAIRPRGRPAMP